MSPNVLPDPPTLAREVAGALIRRLAEAQSLGRVPSVALTGGTIASAIHRELARLGPNSAVQWHQVDFWWGDERFVPAGTADRNDAEVLPVLHALGVDPQRIHPMPAVTVGCGSVDQAAARYGAEVRQHGSEPEASGEFEVVMLGVGPDGHVASLFPGHRALDADSIAVGVIDSPKPPPQRVTLTLAALNRARAVWFVASGSAKAEAVAAAHRSGPVAELPARGVHGRIETLWWLDDEASSLL
ncbi:6-phosphogluconolactonase [Nocardioides sp. Bht2]|uniref:6-phosphogluconolactonase n=1 Tax=Nocardioides sp. Bht2 TaxID=3392297 RepID=UPI0039B53A7B